MQLRKEQEVCHLNKNDVRIRFSNFPPGAVVMEVGVDGTMVIMEDITTTSQAHVPLIMEEERGVQRRLLGAQIMEGIMEEEGAGQMEVMATLAGILEVQDTTLDIMEGGTMGEEDASGTVSALVLSNAAFCTMAISVPSHNIMDRLTNIE